MENLREQFLYLDTSPNHVYTAAQHHPSAGMINMNSTNVINQNINKETSNSGLQSYHQDHGLGEIGNVIRIPYYFENNNVYSRFNNNNNFLDQTSEFQNNNHNNNMLLQSNSNFAPPNRLPSQIPQMVDTRSQYSGNLPFLHLFGSVFGNPSFPSPNPIETRSLPVSTLPYPLVSLNDTFNYNRVSSYDQSSSVAQPLCSQEYTNSRGVPSYETECHVAQSTNSLCSQKPPVYTKWTEEEDELLRAAIDMYGPHKWSLIAAHVPNRTPMQCSTRWLGALNPTIHKGRWTPEEDSELKESVGEFIDLVDSDGHPQPIPWNKIASRIPHRTGIQCQARWSEALDPSVRKGKWSLEEDEILKEGVRRYGRCWIRIAELIEGRTQRQCRTRWVQIKNKQAKLEREGIAVKAATTTKDDEGCDMLTPPRTAPSTPAVSLLPGFISINHGVASVKNPTSPTETSPTNSL